MAQTTGAATWFSRWLIVHKKLCPHQQWRIYEGDEEGKRLVYRGWIDAFERAGITYGQAVGASRNLQSNHPGYPEHHLSAVLAEARAIKARQAQIDERAERRADRERAAAHRDHRSQLQDEWDRLTPARRNAIRGRVEQENPALLSVPRWIHWLCLDALDEQEAAPRPRKQAGTFSQACA